MFSRLLSTLLLLTTALSAVAADPKEETRMLLHTLAYLGQDYKNAVQDGKVLSESEYAEMTEFSETVENRLKNLQQLLPSVSFDSALLYASQIRTAVGKKAEAVEIARLCRLSAQELYARTGYSFTPTALPDLSRAKSLYEAECSRCHGSKGDGKGPESAGLDPAPASFLDNERISGISPLGAFNTIRLGVEGTAMAAHQDLSDDEVWTLAFYVISLRYGADDPSFTAKAEEIRKKLNPGPEILASLSDRELLAKYASSGFSENELLKALRSASPAPSAGDNQLLSLAGSLLDRSLEAYRAGDPDEAAKLALQAYLNGIEPVEARIKANSPELFYQLEEKMAAYRQKIKEGAAADALTQYHSICIQTIQQAAQTIGKKETNPLMLALSTFGILFREGLEAFLVVMVLLSILGAAGAEKLKQIVHLGWISAIALGGVCWFLLNEIIRSNMLQVEIMEGFIALLAVGMLLYIGFWLHSQQHAAQWKTKVKSMMDQAMQTRSLLWLGGLSFTVAFREVFESILFITAIDMESGGEQTRFILLGVALALISVLVMALLVNRFSARLPIPTLFTISSVVMGVLAVILAGKGIHSLQEAGWLSSHASPLSLRVELLGMFPTTETLLAQLLVFLLVAALWKITRKASAPKVSGKTA